MKNVTVQSCGRSPRRSSILSLREKAERAKRDRDEGCCSGGTERLLKNILSAILLAALSIFSTGAADEPAPPKPAPEHAWLQQLVGEWDVEGEGFAGPEQPPVKSKGVENARMVGGFWVMTEIKTECMGMAMTGILTLGYDPEKKVYIATWIDSMTAMMWRYEGRVDATGKILTLETEGPSMEDPAKRVKYRESIEIKDKDHKVFTSTIERDGKWVTFMTMRYTRKK